MPGIKRLAAPRRSAFRSIFPEAVKWKCTIPWKTDAFTLSLSLSLFRTLLFKTLFNHSRRFSFCLIVVRVVSSFYYFLRFRANCCVAVVSWLSGFPEWGIVSVGESSSRFYIYLNRYSRDSEHRSFCYLVISKIYRTMLLVVRQLLFLGFIVEQDEDHQSVSFDLCVYLTLSLVPSRKLDHPRRFSFLSSFVAFLPFITS